MIWPSLTPDQIVAKAREFIGTKWHHDARLKGIGIDCSGLVICTFQELGVPVEDVRGYSPNADSFELMRRTMDSYLQPVQGDRRPGDVILFRGRLMYNHCGFFAFSDGAPSLIHAYSSPSIMRVVEQPLDDSW